MSRYTLLGPTPFVVVEIRLGGARNLGGGIDVLRGGKAGFSGVERSPKPSGTIDISERAGKATHDKTRTFPSARIVTTLYLPEPNPLQVLPFVHQ